MAKRRRQKKLPMYIRLQSKRAPDTRECSMCPVRVYKGNIQYLQNGRGVCPNCYHVIQQRKFAGFCWACNVRQGFVPHGLCGICYILSKRGQLPKLTAADGEKKCRYYTLDQAEMPQRQPLNPNFLPDETKDITFTGNVGQHLQEERQVRIAVERALRH